MKILLFHHQKGSVVKQGKNVALTVKEFKLFMTLLEHRNQVMTREQLLDSV